MVITDGYSEVPGGRLAAVVTYLEMLERPPHRPVAGMPGLTIRRVEKPELDWYRRLFRAIGEPWLWFSRLRLSDDELRAIIHDPGIEISALEKDGAAEGLIELDFREWPEAELAFFGVTTALVGSGAGSLLMAHALEDVWSRGARRFWLHTCTLDHPKALMFYRKWGFIPYKREIEVAPDPRLTGEMRLDAAPQIPVI